MAYTFTTQQINNIQTAVDNIGDNDNWYLAYEAVATALEEALADTDDSPDVPYVSAEDRAYVDAVHV